MTAPTAAGLTMPTDHFCPSCGVHNRAQDGFNDAKHILMPLCPVCADILHREAAAERRGAEQENERLRTAVTKVLLNRHAAVGQELLVTVPVAALRTAMQLPEATDG